MTAKAAKTPIARFYLCALLADAKSGPRGFNESSLSGRGLQMKG